MKIKLGQTIIAFCLLIFFVSTAFSQDCDNPLTIKQYKTRSVGNFSYVIFDITKNENSLFENYSVTTASPPFTGYVEDDGEIPVKGSKFKKIVFRSINWMCEPKKKRSNLRNAVKDVKMLYSFEGIAEFAVGYGAKSRYITSYHYDAGSVTKIVMKFRK